MGEYNPRIDDIRFVLKEVAGLDEIAALPGYEQATPDLVDAVLEEAGKLASEVLAPLNRVGDRQGSVLENGIVRTPDGFKDAYRRFVDGGWNGIPFNPDHGGQGLPWLVATAVTEMWDAANTAWSLCPMLTIGTVEAISAHGSEEMKALYLPKLVSGEWTGTMNLTEPQAGTDVGALRSRAVPEGDHYRITGQKIFITWGDHDYTDNIIHLVLARTPDAPEGVKGISLFLVPKVLVNEDGSLGEPNDLRTVSLEHKLGIHASPTAVMAYGDDGGAIGYLIGEENKGMACMFTMMNSARLNVGLLGLSTAERAYQEARDYALERVQSRDISGGGGPVTIIHHPDVRRMLMSMKAGTEAMRALAYYTAAALDRSKRHPDAATRKREQGIVDLLTPVTKAWCTDTGCAITSIGIQVHGGMGFIEESGAPQHFRDARIHPIYEGTNGIQANDLLGRKVARDGGETAKSFIATMRALDNELGAAGDGLLGDDLAAIRAALNEGCQALTEATDWVLETFPGDPHLAAAGAAHYLTLFGNVTGGWLMAKSALAAAQGKADGNGDAGFYEAKITTARFFADQVLSGSRGLLSTITKGGGTIMALAEEQF
ncbi:MAG: acyl-CoA dehydrogenase [Alphaproteobacteria bacterium]